MKRKMICTLLAALMILQLAGCGSPGSNSETSSSPAAGTDSSAAVAESSTADPMGKYETPITIHFARQVDDTIEANVLANYPDQTIEDNFWLKTYEDELGIKVVYDWIVKGGDEYKQKLNVTLASNEIPDMMSVEATPLMQLVEADMIQDMSSVYEKYASPLSKALMNQDGDAPFIAARKDGKLFGLPNTGGSIDSVDLMWLRTDWLEKLKLKAPTTMDEVLTMIDAFTNADFDGNNKKDAVGMVIAGTDLWGGYAGLKGFFNAYGAYPQNWVEKDGKLVYGSIQPENKEALIALNSMFTKGYLDKEFGVKDGGKAGESAGSGLAGFSFGQQWNSLWPLQSCKDNFPDSQWSSFPIPSATGNAAKAQISLGTTSWMVVNKNFDKPEALVKMMNLFMEKCWGETGDNGKYYAPPEAEGVWKLSPVSPSPPNKNLDAYLEIEEARQKKDASDLKGEALSIQSKLDSFYSGSKEGFALWGWERIYGPDPSSYSAIDKYVKENRTIMDQFVGAPTATMTEKMSTLKKMQDEVFTKIILGESSIDEFDKFVDDFMKLGGQQITTEVNEWYESSK